MANELFWKILVEFNCLMKAAVEGPSCIDPSICHGDCCSIKIDVPKLLAKEYIKQGYATSDDFIRSNIFAFHLRFDEVKGKCFLFDKKINGCSVHSLGIKPPQCYIYPTNFSNPELKTINCKKATDWKIKDSEKAKKAEKLLQKYIFLCQIEAKKEMRNIKKRIKKIRNMQNQDNSISPSRLAGFKDGWDCFGILSAEGRSLQMKKFCQRYNKNCKFISNNSFLECECICPPIKKQLLKFLELNLYNHVKKYGLDHEGAYPLYKLFRVFEITT